MQRSLTVFLFFSIFLVSGTSGKAQQNSIPKELKLLQAGTILEYEMIDRVFVKFLDATDSVRTRESGNHGTIRMEIMEIQPKLLEVKFKITDHLPLTFNGTPDETPLHYQSSNLIEDICRRVEFHIRLDAEQETVEFLNKEAILENLPDLVDHMVALMDPNLNEAFHRALKSGLKTGFFYGYADAISEYYGLLFHLSRLSAFQEPPFLFNRALSFPEASSDKIRINGNTPYVQEEEGMLTADASITLDPFFTLCLKDRSFLSGDLETEICKPQSTYYEPCPVMVKGNARIVLDPNLGTIRTYTQRLEFRSKEEKESRKENSELFRSGYRETEFRLQDIVFDQR